MAQVLIVDLVSQSKIEQLGGNVGAIDLWRSLSSPDHSSEMGILAEQLLQALETFASNITSSNSSGQEHIQSILHSIQYTKIGTDGRKYVTGVFKESRGRCVLA